MEALLNENIAIDAFSSEFDEFALNDIDNFASGTDEMAYYMNLIKSNEGYRRLTNEEEVYYFTAYKENPTKELRDFLFKHNMRLVVSIANKYKSRATNLSLMDLVSEGNLGLLKAIDKFDVSKGFKFSTYAIWWIKQKIQRSIYDTDTVIRLPVHTQEKLTKFKVFNRSFHIKNGRFPNEKEVAKELKIKRSEAKELIDLYFNVVTTTSLNTPLGEAEHGEIDEIGYLIEDDKAPDAFEECCKSELQRILNDYIDEYLATKTRSNKERARDIILRRTGINGTTINTLDEIGKDYGITRERVRQIELGFIKYLRHPKRREVLEDFIQE